MQTLYFFPFEVFLIYYSIEIAHILKVIRLLYICSHWYSMYSESSGRLNSASLSFFFHQPMDTHRSKIKQKTGDWIKINFFIGGKYFSYYFGYYMQLDISNTLPFWVIHGYILDILYFGYIAMSGSMAVLALWGVIFFKAF